jgi:hypothetical protein
MQMKTERINQWLQLLGGFAVLVGLFMVFMELRQVANITRAELGSETLMSIQSIHQIMTSKEYAETYVKVLDESEDLDLQDIVRMDRLLTQLLILFEREGYLYNRGLFAERSGTIRLAVPHFFGNRYAQAWWLANRSRWRPWMVEQVDLHLQQLSPDTDERYYEKIISNM